MTPKSGIPSRRLLAQSVSKAGKTVNFSADDVELRQIAAHLGLPSGDSIAATFLLQPVRGDMLRVTGTLKASVHQLCIISLEPFPVTITEAVDVLFAPPEKLGPITKAEIERTLEDEDPPEPLDNGAVDLWLIAIDHLAVALDPYPRAQGIEMKPESDPEAKESPFAALAMLKKGLEKS